MRLIDADALDAEMYHKSFEVDDGRNVWNSGLWIRYKVYEEASRDAPTVDAVPVIRCKDCKYAKCIERNDDWWECSHDKRVMHGIGFCSWAEREEE